jgi:amidase
MNRRDFVLASTAASLAAANAARAVASAAPTSAELSLADIAAGFAQGHLTSVELTSLYLARIEAMNTRGPNLRAVLETNPKALEIAAALDAERKAGKRKGPLHGVPVLIKDNIETSDPMIPRARWLVRARGFAAHRAPARRGGRDTRQSQYE